MEKKGMKTYSLDEVTDQQIGKKGTHRRDEFENEIRLDLIGNAIKQARKERNYPGTTWRIGRCTKGTDFEKWKTI